MKTRIPAFLLVLLLTLTLLAGCGSDLPPVYVQSVSAIMGYGNLGESSVTAGLVVARNEVKITKDDSRTVSERLVEVGQTVQAGEVLFVYDTDQMKLTIDKAKLEIEQLKNKVTDFGKQIEELEKERLYAAESDKLAYTIQIQALEADRKETEYNITVRERELQALEGEDVSGEVQAPVDGTIKSINENGEYDSYTGMPLPYMTIVESGAYRVKGKVNELNRADFYVGQEVLLRSRVDASQTWTGVITTMDESPEEDNNNNYYYYDGGSDEMTSSSSYPFYLDLDSMDGLILGQHLYIEPRESQTEEEQTLWLDASYILEEDGHYYVWAADRHDELEKREISVGQFDEMFYRYEILAGLTLDDRIAFPDESVQAGAPVTDTYQSEEEEVWNDDGMVTGGVVG